jgi:hypothetical protein
MGRNLSVYTSVEWRLGKERTTMDENSGDLIHSMVRDYRLCLADSPSKLQPEHLEVPANEQAAIRRTLGSSRHMKRVARGRIASKLMRANGGLASWPAAMPMSQAVLRVMRVFDTYLMTMAVGEGRDPVYHGWRCLTSFERRLDPWIVPDPPGTSSVFALSAA